VGMPPRAQIESPPSGLWIGWGPRPAFVARLCGCLTTWRRVDWAAAWARARVSLPAGAVAAGFQPERPPGGEQGVRVLRVGLIDLDARAAIAEPSRHREKSCLDLGRSALGEGCVVAVRQDSRFVAQA